MLALNINELTLAEMETPAEPSLGARYAFPIYAATGAAATAVVYFEVAPGKRLGRHQDSSEEVLYIVEGEGEATVGEERIPISAGSLAVIPALVPHDIRNTGSVPIKLIGFFAGSAIVHTFLEPLLPGAEVTIISHGPEGESLFAGTPFVPAMVS